jgi:hypothetical protein
VAQLNALRRGAVAAGLLIALALGGAAAPAPTAGTAMVDLTAGKPAAVFRPDDTFGAGLDGANKGDNDRLYTPHNVEAMRSAGLKRITYRLRTELGIEAWHWNPEGTWSDPANAQGYWVSSDRPDKPILISNGYSLPRRGDTIDMANNAGYSRLDDGDPTSFWKSNPYLDVHYTHEAKARPQWAIVELDDMSLVDAARLIWAEPHAVSYQVQYWVGADEYDPKGRWITFPGGSVQDGRGGEAELKLAPAPVRTQFIRLLMTQGSGTAPTGSTDIRDRLGYALAEVGLGTLDASGQFHDLLRHAKGRLTQTVMHVSSTDPWHRAVDFDPETEQPGLDRVFTSGLTNGLPMMVPVPVFYDTPENAAAEIRYLKRRGYPLAQVELGEEPDGQYVDAADFGALYLQGAQAVRSVDPKLTVGGPSLQNGVSDTWLDPRPDRSWTSQFIAYLKSRGRMADLGFFSFERYPFDEMCGDLHGLLTLQTKMMGELFTRLDADGVPRNIPWIITEYGFSAYSGRAMSEMPSALLMADMVGDFLTRGGHAAYLFGYGPNWPTNQHLECAGYGNMMLHLADPNGQAGARMPTYYTARLLTGVWTQPGMGDHALYPVKVDVGGDRTTVTAYAVKRPDQRWAILLINRSPTKTLPVKLRFRTKAGEAALKGAAEAFQYSSADYSWKDDGENGHPVKDDPPRRLTLSDARAPIQLPPDSLTVVRGRLP